MNKTSLAVVLFAIAGFANQGHGSLPIYPSQPTFQRQPESGVRQDLPKDRSVELTLSDAIYLALRDNRLIRSAYLDRVAQKFDLRVAEDRYTPRLLINGSYLSASNQDDRYLQGAVTPTATLLSPYGTRVSVGWAYRHTNADAAGISRNDGANLSLVQPLLRGAGREVVEAPLRLARLAEQANRLNLKSTVTQTITRIIGQHRMLLQAQEQFKISEASLKRARQLLEVNRALIDAGRMAEFEIVQTEAEVASQELAHEGARNQLDVTRLALLQLLAVDLSTPVEAIDSLNAQPLQLDAARALQQAEAFQPAYLAQLIYSEQANIYLALGRNARLWDVSLVGAASQVRDRSAAGSSLPSWQRYVGVQVEIPLGDLSSRQAELRAQVDQRNQELRLEEARQQLALDVKNAVREIGTRWRQYEIAQRATELSRRKLDIEREKLVVGRSSNFQVLSFESDLRNAENVRVSALISYLNSQAELDQTLGTTLDSWDISLND